MPATRAASALLAALVCCSVISARPRNKKPVPLPNQFEIGVHTFFDFGPPNDFYELYVVRPAEKGTKVERLLLTPAVAKCWAPAKLETSSALLTSSIQELLGQHNPCAIPEKDLARELKRCKKCQVFSGSNVRMQVSCGGSTRLIRSDILDRDMFDPKANTPENTAWTMLLLTKLDKVLGPGVMEKPSFQLPENSQKTTPAPPSGDDGVLSDIAGGGYDSLFPASELKLSALYQETQQPAPPSPSVRLKKPPSVPPETQYEVTFPPLARMTGTEGDVTVAFEIGVDGTPLNPTILSGHPLLRAAALAAVSKWKFPRSSASQNLEATFEFALNCHN